jgi:hypothetical protein
VGDIDYTDLLVRPETKCHTTAMMARRSKM